MALSQQDYQVRQGETTDAYNKRIADLRASQPTGTTTGGVPLYGNGNVSNNPISGQNLTPSYPSAFVPAPIITPTLALTPQEQKQSDVSGQIQSLNTDLAGRSEFQTQQETAQGIPALQKTLNDLQAQQKTLTNEAAQIQLTPQRNDLAVTEIDTRQRNEKLRQNALASLSVSSLVNAAQGNLSNAQYLADKAVSERFDPLQAKHDALVQNLELIINDPQTTIQEKNRAQAQLDAQNRQQKINDQNKENYAGNLALANELIKNGETDTNLLKQVQNARDEAGNFSTAVAQQLATKSPYNTSLSKTASIQEYEYAKDHGYTGTYTQYQNEDANRKATANAVSLSPVGVDLAAQQYLLTGQMPSLGVGSGSTRISILERAASLAQQNGLDASNIVNQTANYKTQLSSLSKLRQQKGLILAFENTAGRNLDLATSLSGKVDNSGIPILNKVYQAFQTNVAGDADVQAFKVAVTTAANEYAKVVTGQTGGAAVSDSARKEVELMLSSTFSPQQFAQVVNVMKQDMANRRLGLENEEQAISNALDGLNLGGNQTGQTNQINNDDPLGLFP